MGGRVRSASFEASICLSEAEGMKMRAMQRWSAVGRGVNFDKKYICVASSVWAMIGRLEVSIHPRTQSILGWKAVNQGYPRIALFIPRSDRKNLIRIRLFPICISKSV